MILKIAYNRYIQCFKVKKTHGHVHVKRVVLCRITVQALWFDYIVMKKLKNSDSTLHSRIPFLAPML